MFFDFDDLEAALPSITEDLIDHHQAEESSPAAPDRPEATRSVGETEPHLSRDMVKRASDQHYRDVQEVRDPDQSADDPEPWMDYTPRLTCWNLLEDSPGSGGTSESGEDDDLEESGDTLTVPPVISAPDDTGDASEVTDSDKSGASIFGLRRATHEVERGDELSDSSSQDSGEMALTGRKHVHSWRKEHTLLNDEDFARVFLDFKEAYRSSGQAVSRSWCKARIRSEPSTFIYDAEFKEVVATATKIREVDKQNITPSARKHTSGRAALRISVEKRSEKIPSAAVWHVGHARHVSTAS